MFYRLNIKNEYRSPRDNVPKEFYVPLLSEAVLYRRSVGYFSSRALVEISYGIEKLVKNNGKIELICSPNLDEEDVEAINKGYIDKAEELVANKIIKEWKEPKNIVENNRLNFLANLISNDVLEIKIALAYKNNKFGLYHEKMGLFYDRENNVVAFSGSMNETYNALSENYETIDVYKSWESNGERVKNKEKAFLDLWNNNDEFAVSIDFPDAIKNKILSYKKEDIDFEKLEDETKEYLNNIKDARVIINDYNIIKVDENIKLRDYQLNAIEEWKNNNYCGIYDMATGSGKTYTAYASIVELINYCKNKNEKVFVVIVCPFQHLVEQWYDDKEKFGLGYAVVGYGDKTKYIDKLNKLIRHLNDGIIDYAIVYTTNASFKRDTIQNAINKVKTKILLVVDEAHYIGSNNSIKFLDDKYDYRLALSATIDRHNDEEGTEFIHNYFGKTCIKYTLEEAIKNGNLCHYEYYVILNYLDENERYIYEEYSKEIKKHIKINEKGKMELTEKAKKLLIYRSWVVASANHKFTNFSSLIDKHKADNYMIVYCGVAPNIDYDEDTDEELKYIDVITRLMGNEKDMTIMRYTSRENVEERKNIKENFARGEANALVAIKCLDEGVDIPKIKKAFILASTTNPREYVQRRGRVLRKAEGKEKAYIYDFVTLPYSIELLHKKLDVNVECYKSLIKNEIYRMEEFSSLADNKLDTMQIINDIREAYRFDIIEKEEKCSV